MTTSSIHDAPVLLGTAAHVTNRGHCWDLLGFTELLLFSCFPQTLDGLAIVLLWPKSLHGEETRDVVLTLTDSLRPQCQGNSTFSLWPGELPSPSQEDLIINSLSRPSRSLKEYSRPDAEGSVSLLSIGPYYFLPIPAPKLLIVKPTTLSVIAESNGKRYQLGSIWCGFQRPPPLTSDEIKTIGGRHVATSSISAQFGCTKCGERITMHLPLDITGEIKVPPGSIYLHAAPEVWNCTCGHMQIPTAYAKLGLHDLFRHGSIRTDKAIELGYTPVYRPVQLDNVIAQYSRLISSSPLEETVQKFLNDNHAFWSFLSPSFVRPKPRIQSRLIADFLIHSCDGTLYLIEIEKPQTSLWRAAGGQSAELQRGIDQINQWRMQLQNHRHAVLDDLGIDHTRVLSIRYIIIAGLSYKINAKDLRLIRESLAADCLLLTFDELATRLRQVSVSMKQIMQDT